MDRPCYKDQVYVWFRIKVATDYNVDLDRIADFLIELSEEEIYNEILEYCKDHIRS